MARLWRKPDSATTMEYPTSLNISHHFPLGNLEKGTHNTHSDLEIPGQDLRDPRFKVQYALWHRGTEHPTSSSRLWPKKKEPRVRQKKLVQNRSSENSGYPISWPCNRQLISIWLVVWNCLEHQFDFSTLIGFRSSFLTDFYPFQRGGPTT